ncbi:hypothetical protein V6R21_11545 [Limibacter armeniacum]|uniref:DUF6985 domain-containing protein n=1 Tax=Limibacter armeniacum TaxID=466084 RepID=UPI002FE5EE5D
MEKFTFVGDWEFKLKLDLLSSDQIDCRINDVKDENPNPEIEQINSVNYLISNQGEILTGICQALKEKFIPTFNSLVDDDQEQIPTNQNDKELYDKELYPGRIIISNIYKDNYAYVLLSFGSTQIDPEHGISFIFHKNRYVGSDDDFKEAHEELGFNYKKILQDISAKNQAQFDNKDYNFHEPKSESVTLKPWQIQENRIYPYRLLQTNQPEKFIDFMENKGIHLELDISSLKNVAENQGLKKVSDFLENM